jgi:hypothetical protein
MSYGPDQNPPPGSLTQMADGSHEFENAGGEGLVYCRGISIAPLFGLPLGWQGRNERSLAGLWIPSLLSIGALVFAATANDE